MKTFAIATIALMASPLASAAAVSADIAPQSGVAANEADVTKRADCVLRAKWYNNWPSGGFRRYGVKLTADPPARRHDLIEIYCALVRGENNAEIQNRACYSNNDSDGSYNADITTFEGKHGHDLYFSFFQDRLNWWRDSSKCDFESDL